MGSKTGRRHTPTLVLGSDAYTAHQDYLMPNPKLPIEARRLVATIRQFHYDLESLMCQPPSHESGQQIASLANKLQLAVDIFCRYGISSFTSNQSKKGRPKMTGKSATQWKLNDPINVVDLGVAMHGQNGVFHAEHGGQQYQILCEGGQSIASLVAKGGSTFRVTKVTDHLTPEQREQIERAQSQSQERAHTG